MTYLKNGKPGGQKADLHRHPFKVLLDRLRKSMRSNPYPGLRDKFLHIGASLV